MDGDGRGSLPERRTEYVRRFSDLGLVESDLPGVGVVFVLFGPVALISGPELS